MEERKIFASIEDVKNNALATLKKVSNKFLHEAISSNNLKVMWMQLKPNFGMMAGTSTLETLNQISQNWL